MIITVPFSGSVSAEGELVQVSRKIGFSFRVIEVSATFEEGTGNLFWVYFFLARDDNLPASGKPPDDNLLSTYSARDYLLGDSIHSTVSLCVEYKDPPGYVKCYAKNYDLYAHQLNSWITIEKIEER